MAEGNTALTVVLVVVGMVLPFIALGVVSWIFLRAKRREDAAEKEREWQSVRSS